MTGNWGLIADTIFVRALQAIISLCRLIYSLFLNDFQFYRDVVEHF